MQDNNRRFPRANYPCQLTLWAEEEVYETILANTANIGAGGLCVYLTQSIYIGTKVDVQISFPKKTTAFKCKGIVTRSKKEGDKFYDTGIQFEPMDELKQAFILGQVAELVEQEKKGQG